MVIQFTKGGQGWSYGEIASSSKFCENLEVHQFGMDRVVYSQNVNMEDFKEAKKGWELAKEAIKSNKYQIPVITDVKEAQKPAYSLTK